MLSSGLATVRRPGREALLGRLPYVLVGLVALALPPFSGTDVVGLMTKTLIFAIFALSLNLLFGHAGLFSLGHAAFFGAGAYTTAILTTRVGIETFWIVFPIAIVVSALLAAIYGVIALRVSGIYFLLVTLALGQLLYSLAMTWRTVMGGSTGVYGVQYPSLGIPGFTMGATSYYYLVLVLFVVCFVLLARVVNSPFGHSLKGIREDEHRMRHLGYHTWACKYAAFVVGGTFAGVSGALFAHYASVVVPNHFGVVTSTLAMLMVIVGSTSVFWGPALGAGLVVLVEQYASVYTPERWPLILGGVFVLVVMLLRGGIGAQLVRVWNRLVRQWKQ